MVNLAVKSPQLLSYLLLNRWFHLLRSADGMVRNPPDMEIGSGQVAALISECLFSTG